MAERTDGMIFNILVDATKGTKELKKFVDASERTSKGVVKNTRAQNVALGRLESVVLGASSSAVAARRSFDNFTSAQLANVAAGSGLAAQHARLTLAGGAMNRELADGIIKYGGLTSATMGAEMAAAQAGTTTAALAQQQMILSNNIGAAGMAHTRYGQAAAGGAVASKVATAGVQGLTAAMGALLTVMLPLLTIATLFILMKKALGFVKESIALSKLQFQQERTLQAALASRGHRSRELVEQLKAEAAALQLVTDVGDEQILQIQSLLIQFGAQTDIVTELSEQVINLTKSSLRAGNQMASYRTVALATGKAIAGNVGALTRFGANLRKSEVDMHGARGVLKALQEQFSGRARAEAHTYAGLIQQVANAWGDVREKTMDFITRSPSMIAFLEGFVRILSELANKLTQNVDILKPILTLLVQLGIVGLLAAKAMYQLLVQTGFLDMKMKEFRRNLELVATLMGWMTGKLGEIASASKEGQAKTPFDAWIETLEKVKKDLDAMSGQLGIALPPSQPTPDPPPEPLKFGFEEIRKAHEGLTQFIDSYATLNDLIKSNEMGHNGHEQMQMLAFSTAHAKKKLEEMMKSFPFLSERIHALFAEIDGLGTQFQIFPEHGLVDELLDVDIKAGSARAAIEQLNNMIQQGLVPIGAGREMMAGLAQEMLDLQAIGVELSEDEEAWAWTTVLEERLRMLSEQMMDTNATFIATTAQMMGAGEHTAQTIAAAYTAIGAAADLMGDDKAAKKFRKVQGIMLLAAGIFTLWKGFTDIAQGIASQDPKLIAGGAFEVAKGIGAIAEAKKLGASSGGGASGGGGGASAPVYLAQSNNDERQETGTGEARKFVSPRPSDLANRDLGIPPIGNTVNINALDSKSFEAYLNDPDNRNIASEAVGLGLGGR